jgi:hypothetical protein
VLGSADDSWSENPIAAAVAEARRPSGVGGELGGLVEFAEVLARTLARATLGLPPKLSSVLATLEADQIDHRVLTARAVTPPKFKGYGLTRELETWIAIVDAGDRVVGDVCFYWTAPPKGAVKPHTEAC